MKAYWYESAGAAADVLEYGDIDTPEPGRGEVRVKIAVSAINPTDWKRRQIGRELAQFPRIIPNNDGSGTIDAIGPDVDPARIGERVWIFGAQAMRPMGTAAEHCVLPSRQALYLPDAQSFEDGACLGVPVVTAHRGLFADGDISGKSILITGGAGRVGRYAVQMAKRAEAMVVATASSTEKLDHLRDLGADHTLNYKTDDIIAAVRDITGGKGVDRILDVAFGANVGDAPKLVRDNGVIASYSSDGMPKPEIPFQALMYKNVTIRPFAIFGMPREAQDLAFADIEKLLAENVLDHLVGARFTFDQMIEAHEAVETDEIFGVCIVGGSGPA